MVNNRFFVSYVGFILALLSSCTSDISYQEDCSTDIKCYSAIINSSTKTSLESGGKVSWNEGDIVRYYSTSNGNIGEYSILSSGLSSNLYLEVPSNSSYLIAVYGGESITDNINGNSFSLNGAVKAEQSGKFEDAHISVVKTYDIDNATLSFTNITSILRFSLERTDISYVIFSSKDGTKIHGNGVVDITFSGISVSGELGESKGSSIKVKIGSNGEYFISLLPCSLPSGFMMQFYDSSDNCVGYVDYQKPLSISRNTVVNLGALDSKINTDIEPDIPDIEYNPDLSINGTSNCYIVPIGGDYYFDATVQGNSKDTFSTQVVSAATLWESFGTDVTPNNGDIIKNVRYSNGKVYFTSTGTNGNAVIAIRDRDEEIIWSWHIWCCMGYDADFYGQEYYHNAGTMMDRNLGAISATPGDVGALGLLYQWGRKDPFLSYASTIGTDEARSTIIWPETETSIANQNISYSIGHPTTYIQNNVINADWIYTGSEETDDTRWMSQKTKYDPCPTGWRVPDGGNNGIWAKALGTSSKIEVEKDADNQGYNLSGIFGDCSIIWYPSAGMRMRSGELDIVYGDTRHNSIYWSVTPDRYLVWKLTFSENAIYPNDSYYRYFGHSVRCQKE